MYEGDLQEQIYKNSQIHKFIVIAKFKSLSNTFYPVNLQHQLACFFSFRVYSQRFITLSLKIFQG